MQCDTSQCTIANMKPATICLVHEASEGFPPRRRDGQDAGTRQVYSVCIHCDRPIVRFSETGRWVVSTTPCHPYRTVS